MRSSDPCSTFPNSVAQPRKRAMAPDLDIQHGLNPIFLPKRPTTIFVYSYPSLSQHPTKLTPFLQHVLRFPGLDQLPLP